MMTVRDTAVAASKAGIVVVPVAEDGSKRPALPSWTEYQERQPTNAELNRWFPKDGQERAGLGFITGAVSGGLVLFEFEDAETIVAFKELAKDLGLWDLVKRVELGYCESTPGGGSHWFYQCDDPGGNTKLASKPCPGAPACGKHETGKQHILIETRGEHGFAVVAPSSGPVHETGRPYVLEAGGAGSIARITTDERDALWALARSLDEWPRERPAHDEIATIAVNGPRPGDIWAAQTSWREILEPHGWTFLARRGALEYYRRPGKTGPYASATAGVRGGDPDADYLYVFSTSTGFDAERGYSKFSAYALLNHGNDYAAAARELASMGFRDDGVTYSTTLTASEVTVERSSEAVSARERDDVAATSGGMLDGPDSRALYSFEHIFPPGHFVHDYIAYASQRTDAAYEYHEAAALTLLAAATPKLRAYLGPWPAGLPTNLYVLLVGSTTSSRKSTATSFAGDIVERAVPDSVIPQQFSPEAFLEQLAARSGLPTVWLVDEFGEQLGAMAARKYMDGMSGLLMTLYSGQNYRAARHSKRLKGGMKIDDVDLITDPHFSILGASTPTILDRLTSQSVESGLMPRFAVVWPLDKPERIPLGDVPASLDAERAAIQQRVHEIYTWSLSCQPAPRAEISAAALCLLDDFSAEIEVADEAICARLPAMAIKLAMLSAIGEGAVPRVTRLVVEERDAMRGVAVARRWRSSMLRFGGAVGGLGTEQRTFEQRVSAAQKLLETSATGVVRRRDVSQSLHLKGRDLLELEDVLVERDFIEVIKGVSTGGRPPTFWKRSNQKF